jgi:hypothetical protein
MSEHFFEEGSKAIVVGGFGTVTLLENGDFSENSPYHVFDEGTVVTIISCGKGFDLDGYYLNTVDSEGQSQYIKKKDLIPFGEPDGE